MYLANNILSIKFTKFSFNDKDHENNFIKLFNWIIRLSKLRS